MIDIHSILFILLWYVHFMIGILRLVRRRFIHIHVLDLTDEIHEILNNIIHLWIVILILNYSWSTSLVYVLTTFRNVSVFWNLLIMFDPQMQIQSRITQILLTTTTIVIPLFILFVLTRLLLVLIFLIQFLFWLLWTIWMSLMTCLLLLDL